jgi:hypothetical protein
MWKSSIRREWVLLVEEDVGFVASYDADLSRGISGGSLGVRALDSASNICHHATSR